MKTQMKYLNGNDIQQFINCAFLKFKLFIKIPYQIYELYMSFYTYIMCPDIYVIGYYT